MQQSPEALRPAAKRGHGLLQGAKAAKAQGRRPAVKASEDKPGLRLSDLLDVPSTSHGHDNGADVEGNQAPSGAM